MLLFATWNSSLFSIINETWKFVWPIWEDSIGVFTPKTWLCKNMPERSNASPMSNAMVISENENWSNNTSDSITTVALQPDFNDPSSIIVLSIYRAQEGHSRCRSWLEKEKCLSLAHKRSRNMAVLWSVSSSVSLTEGSAWGWSRVPWDIEKHAKTSNFLYLVVQKQKRIH